MDFLQGVVPIRFNTSKKLISHDINSNTYNYKYVFSVEVVPICKDNIVCLPLRLAKSLGSIGQICHVSKVTHLLHLVDPNTAQIAEINASTYFKTPFQTLVKPKQLTEYTVINIEPISDGDRHRFAGQGAISKRVRKAHTGAKTNFLSRNSSEFDVWKMRILWKTRLWNCEFSEKWGFENVNFVKNEILKMWIL